MSKKQLYSIYYSSFNMQAKQISQAITFVSIFLFSSANINAQMQEKEIIQNQFNSYLQNNLQEKIFIHTDKNNYVAGEICWFKIYNVDAYFNKPIDLGKCAYVEIIDKNNKPVLQAKVALDKGAGDGSLYLPATIVSGNYRLRAYTNWMKNYSADYFFEKKITIINVQRAQPENTVTKKELYDIAFFPEGGNLVNDIKSRVGFKFTNRFGKGVYAEGFLLNDNGDTITSFHTLHAGMGSFLFTPLSGVKYKAIINFTDGAHQQKELPQAFNTGYVMQVEKGSNRQIKITVQTPDKNSSKSENVFLFVQTRNIVKAIRSNSLQKGMVTFLLEDTIPGEGISQFTVFNESRQPVCERLFFKQPTRILQIAAATDELLYELRKKINIDISSSKEDGKFVAANMSMAVYKIDSLTGIDGEDINSYLLLSSDLTGIVESPQYYFIQNNDTVIQAADNLMLTQGWRRFNWENVLLNKKTAFNFLPEINGHIVNGKVEALKPGLAIKDIKCYLSVTGTPAQFQTAATDESGNIKFDMKDFYGGSNIIVQTDNAVDSFYRINIESPFYTGNLQKALPPFEFSMQNAALLKMYIAAQVQNTFLFDKLNQSSQNLQDTTAFYFKPDATYFLDNYVRFTTLEEVMREYVTGINVMERHAKFYLTLLNAMHTEFFSGPPLMLLDGIPVFEFNKMIKYDPLKIRKLELVNKLYYLGTNSFEGIVNFTTYKGDANGYEIDPRATVVDYEGLQLQRDFYSPEYATEKQFNSRMPDFRNLLFWSPKIITDQTGKEQTSFYSSDIPGRYAIVIQGISNDGRAGAKVLYFDVKK